MNVPLSFGCLAKSDQSLKIAKQLCSTDAAILGVQRQRGAGSER
jgi:hypothetical protein